MTKYDNIIVPNETIKATSFSNEGKIITGVFEILNHLNYQN